ncbi:MAG: excinuclease ABC subunit C, partial [Hyphomicrobiaceae bacterium]|nr:excinuclease ABC subunit C [Hyphomicrobiaceae bacterium]
GGKPLKSRYRRFRIRTVAGVDDFASMTEVLTRYYGRLIEKGEQPADLVVVDGGVGQLSMARKVLAGYGLHATQLIGLAKREEEIHRERAPSPVRLPRSSPALQLLQRVRDEAHRFAITYHRQQRRKGALRSALDEIPGIGESYQKRLLNHFGSVKAMREASVEDFEKVKGIGHAKAEALYNALHEQ